MVTAGARRAILAAVFSTCLVVLLLLGSPSRSVAQVPPSGAPSGGGETPVYQRAPVVVDGVVLFYVRGITAYPASYRAKVIADRIKTLANDRSLAPDSIRVTEIADRSVITAKSVVVVTLFDVDAEPEGVPRPLLAETVRARIVRAIELYRADRAPREIVKRSLYGLGATAVALTLILLVNWFFRRLRMLLEHRLTTHIEDLKEKSGDAIQTKPLWMVIWGLIATVRTIALIAIAYTYLNFALALFPWTRALAKRVFAIVLDPLRYIGNAIIAALPGLVFIAVLVIVARYLLKIVRVFFAGIHSGRIHFSGFDPVWAWPTYRIVRILLVAFFIVVAYPYIPGSSSGAFKGVTLLLGFVFSLGSSSIIANLVAGYTLIYRNAFKIGDRIRVEDVEGYVTEAGAFVTHLRTIKNEDVVVPNSVISNSKVVNYSALARSRGLILHTTVGIGYETPWRQVEAMLLLAAERTTGILKEPSPFVLQLALGDFAVTYQLNVYTDEPQGMVRRYAELHRNILDVFNEYGVQIMTPAYEADPAQPKMVPREQWFIPPASEPPSPTGGKGGDWPRGV